VNKYCFKNKNYKKYKNLEFLDEIFDRIKQKYNFYNVELLIRESPEVNAYAVGSFRKNVIILTSGILDDYKNKCQYNDQFLKSMEGILAHEMSHIVNRDYFPALLLVTNEKVLNFISKIIMFVFNILIKCFNFIPIYGKYVSRLIKGIYNAFDYIIGFFYYKIILKIYTFIKLQISKQIEYRADKQASQEVGGESMAFALSLLGKSGFFNIFSSHPKTQNRVKKAKKINILNDKNIKNTFLSNVCFFLSFVLLIFLMIKTFKMADINRLIDGFNTFLLEIQNKYILYKSKFSELVNSLAQLIKG
jgi:Zn-dependent protease with chaperone function